jgi:O-antigen ligase
MFSSAAVRRLHATSIAILVLILVVTGSYIRERTVDESDSADWLVVLQLGLCLSGGAIGLILIAKSSGSGPGARRLVLYLIAIIFSIVFSPYSKLAAGYWALLAGTSLLCIGTISTSPDEQSLRRLESFIVYTLALMLLKDSILDWFFLEPSDDGTVYRLGEGTTSANGMGLTAAVAFCMSFMTAPNARSSALWRYGYQALFLAIVLLSRSRVGLLGVVLGMCVRWWLHQRTSPQPRSHLLLASIPCWAGSLVLVAIIMWTMGVQPVTAMVDFVNRSEDEATLMSVTGRTEIWSYAVERVFDGVRSLAFGHGYGVSKFVLNENNWTASFFAYHSHNTVLEVLLSTGIAGALAFLLWLAYALKWLTSFSQLTESFSLEFALRAASVMAVIGFSTLTESDLATKIGPLTIVFIFYALAIDRRAAFQRSRYAE